MSGLNKLAILVPCCFFLVALIKFLYDYLWRPLRIQQMLNSQGMKGPPYRFIHGNNKKVAEMRREAAIKPLGLTHEGRIIFVGTVPEKWVKQRKLANHVFHGESLKNMIPSVITGVETLVARWKDQQGKEIEVFEEFKIMTAEVISRTAFSSSHLEGDKIFDKLSKLSELMIQNYFKTRIPFINKFSKPADLLESEKLAEEVRDIVLKIVKKREDKVANGEADGFGDNLLGLLVNAYHDPDEKNRLSLEDVVDECKTFYFGGQDTVSASLSWTVFLLAIHGDWQDKARREVLDTFGYGIPHPEGLAKLKTMTMIICETLRLYGPSAGLIRKSGRQVRLGNVDMPPDISIRVLNIAVHHDPQVWGEDVHLFKPERFAQGIAKATNNNAGAYFPFGLGPRSCVGMSFAVNEAKIALSMILQRYSFTLSPAYVHSPVSVLVLKPQHGIQIILNSLHDDA